MTIELNIEENIALNLQPKFNIPVYAISKMDNPDLERIASQHPEGAIFVTYNSSTRERQGSGRMYARNMKFICLVFNRNRQGINGIYEIVSKLTDELYTYNYEGIKSELGEDHISPDSTEKGFYIGEQEIIFKTIYPYQFTRS